jgi:DNA modification methylase
MTESGLVELVPIESLNPDPLNPRVMPPSGMAALVRSIGEFGFVEPLVARPSDRLIIGGHMRFVAAGQLGLTHVPVVWFEGDDKAARALNLALNKIGGAWDEAKLATVLAELADVDSLSSALAGFDPTATTLAGFDESEVLAAIGEHLPSDEREEDLAALARSLVRPAERASLTHLGSGFVLGGHRVVCGDARDGHAVAALCKNTAPTMLSADPPFGVGYSAEGAPGRAASSGRPPGRRDRPLGSIAGDDLDADAHAALVTRALQNAAAVLTPGGAVYVCGGTSTTTLYDAAFEAAGFTKSTIVVWDKGSPTLGRRDYQSEFELIWYGWKRGAAHSFYGDRTQTDIWRIPRDVATTYVHPTQKPVALAERAIRNSSRPGEAVLDLFGGSGSTLIAAERAGRRALVMEIDPHFVDVIVARWEAFTGRRAEPFEVESAREAGERDA